MTCIFLVMEPKIFSLLITQNSKMIKKDNFTQKNELKNKTVEIEEEEEEPIEIKYIPPKFNFTENELKNHPAQNPRLVRSSYPGISNIRLNYEGKCGEHFKYPPHTTRDIVFGAFEEYSNNSPEQVMFREKIARTLEITRTTLSKAKFVVCYKGSISGAMEKLFKYYNVELIKAPAKYDHFHIANARFFLFYDYMMKHRSEIDRVLMIDLKDIYVFADIFAAVDPSQWVMMSECFDHRFCLHLGEGQWHNEKLREFYGNPPLREWRSLNVVEINSGLHIGNVNKAIEFCEYYISNFDIKYCDRWAYEQQMTNVIIWTKPNKINAVVIDKCDQLMCFPAGLPAIFSFSNSNSIRYAKDGCSPIVLHKGLPPLWERFYNFENKIN
ncbi:hypothetical protein ENUP19_0274G0043 [Entamoeba nuttalli]|uniref:Glycosyltransferase n=1 Tax=Entamoeba nuttalli TaxID=412467 RepID=A0ABQ0DT79_9EUKA